MRIVKEGMAWLHTEEGVKFYMKPINNGSRSEHNPPHVHGVVDEDGGYDAAFAISDGHKMTKGKFPPKKEKIATKWVRENSEELQRKWDQQDLTPFDESKKIGGKIYRWPWKVVEHRAVNNGIWMGIVAF